jgi:hypothetical protein
VTERARDLAAPLRGSSRIGLPGRSARRNVSGRICRARHCRDETLGFELGDRATLFGDPPVDILTFEFGEIGRQHPRIAFEICLMAANAAQDGIVSHGRHFPYDVRSLILSPWAGDPPGRTKLVSPRPSSRACSTSRNAFRPAGLSFFCTATRCRESPSPAPRAAPYWRNHPAVGRRNHDHSSASRGHRLFSYRHGRVFRSQCPDHRRTWSPRAHLAV